MLLARNYPSLGQKIFYPTNEEVCSGKTLQLRREALIASSVALCIFIHIARSTAPLMPYASSRIHNCATISGCTTYLISAAIIGGRMRYLSYEHTPRFSCSLKENLERYGNKELHELKNSQLFKEEANQLLITFISGIIGGAILAKFWRQPYLCASIAAGSLANSYTTFLFMVSHVCLGDLTATQYFNRLTKAWAAQTPKFEHFPELSAEIQTKILEFAGNATAMSKTNRGFRCSYHGDTSDPPLEACYLESYLISAVKAQVSTIAESLDDSALLKVDVALLRNLTTIKSICGYLLRKYLPMVSQQLVCSGDIDLIRGHPESRNDFGTQLKILLRQATHGQLPAGFEEQDTSDVTYILNETNVFPNRLTYSYTWIVAFRLAYTGQADHLDTLLNGTKQLPEETRIYLLSWLFIPIFEQFPEVMTDALKNSLEAYASDFETEELRLQASEAVERLCSPQSDMVNQTKQELTFEEIDALIENWDFSFEGTDQHTHNFVHLGIAILSDSEIYRTGCELHDAVNALIRKGPYRNKEQFAEADRLLKKILGMDGSLYTRLIVINAYHKICEQLKQLPLIY